MQKLLAFWIGVRSSLWFLPALIVLGAIGLGLGAARLGRVFPGFSQSSLPDVFGFSAEGSRSMLSAIASSMITVAGVAFSITIVALSLAATQYSPRVLRQFRRDRGNQAVLGVFMGIFAYCLVVLPSVRGGDDGGYVPAIAVAFAVVLALVGVGCLIYFIHHVAVAIQASSIIAVLAAETHGSISRLFPQTLGRPEPDPPELLGLRWRAVAASRSGYLQLVNESVLLASAAEYDVLVRMETRIGDFIATGMPLVSVSGEGPVDQSLAKRLAGAFTIDRERTVEQDPAFGFQQLVDVALRALSPSLNDTTTAVLCVNALAELLRHAAARGPETRFRRRDEVLRVIARRPGFGDLTSLAFDQITASAGGNAVVLERILWALETVGADVDDPRRREALDDVARTVGRTAAREVTDVAVRTRLITRATR